jgi:peptidoglycan/xylan/chitin deacetylase (PgdA/CDA1 family)
MPSTFSDPDSTVNKSPIPILVYHQIAIAPKKGASFRGLYVSPSAFARQMAMLKMLGYTGLSMSDLQPYLCNDKVGKVFGITFDDGYLNNLTAALPVLRKYGFTSTCYVVSDLLGSANSWDIQKGIAQTPLMSAHELLLWQAGGQEVGAHTQSHVDLLAVNELTARQQMTHSKLDLEKLLGTPIHHFCYPYGKFNTLHEGIAKQARYHTATTTVRGRVYAATNMLTLPRVPVVNSTTLPVLWLKVATRYEDRKR